MIKITNREGNVKVVTKGAYENFYKPLGYNTVNETGKSVREEKISLGNKEESKESKNLIKDTGKQSYKGK